MTEYVVLKRVSPTASNGEVWEWIGVIEATNDVQAIRAMSQEDGAHNMSAGAVAVPVRNWRPRKPERKVTESTLWK